MSDLEDVTSETVASKGDDDLRSRIEALEERVRNLERIEGLLTRLEGAVKRSLEQSQRIAAISETLSDVEKSIEPVSQWIEVLAKQDATTVSVIGFMLHKAHPSLYPKPDISTEAVATFLNQVLANALSFDLEKTDEGADKGGEKQ